MGKMYVQTSLTAFNETSSELGSYISFLKILKISLYKYGLWEDELVKYHFEDFFICIKTMKQERVG